MTRARCTICGESFEASYAALKLYPHLECPDCSALDLSDDFEVEVSRVELSFDFEEKSDRR